ncbi:hypothetical protein [Brucella sp. IR073]|uniref:hypothetical protein n=1 Tax=unclassified Brucella TaxID=2632610 RepID=UPI003B9869E3
MSTAPKRVAGNISAGSSPSQPASSLKGGGGDGTFDGMEARISALEALAKSTNEKLDKLLDKVSSIEVDVARLSGLPERINKVEASLSNRIDKVEAELSNKIDKVDAKYERYDEKLTDFKADIARLDGRVMNLPTTIQLLGFVVVIIGMAGFFKYIAP